MPRNTLILLRPDGTYSAEPVKHEYMTITGKSGMRFIERGDILLVDKPPWYDTLEDVLLEKHPSEPRPGTQDRYAVAVLGAPYCLQYDDETAARNYLQHIGHLNKVTKQETRNRAAAAAVNRKNLEILLTILAILVSLGVFAFIAISGTDYFFKTRAERKAAQQQIEQAQHTAPYTGVAPNKQANP